MIDEWYKQVAEPLEIGKRHSGLRNPWTGNQRDNIVHTKQNFHGLRIKDTDPWKKLKEGEKPAKREVDGHGVDGVDLGKIRSSIKAVHSYFTETKTNSQ